MFCAAGGSCAAGIPAAIYFNNLKEKAQTQKPKMSLISSDLQEESKKDLLQPSSSSSKADKDISPTEEQETRLKIKSRESIEKLWQQIEGGYKNNQTEEERKNRD